MNELVKKSKQNILFCCVHCNDTPDWANRFDKNYLGCNIEEGKVSCCRYCKRKFKTPKSGKEKAMTCGFEVALLKSDVVYIQHIPCAKHKSNEVFH